MLLGAFAQGQEGLYCICAESQLKGVNKTALAVRKGHPGGTHDPESAMQLLTERKG